jgi:single-stranded-DNA-specific exonuclease
MTSPEKRWRIYPQNTELCEKISTHLNIPPIISQLLLNRGITSLSSAIDFLDPTNDKIVNNFAEDTLKKAADLLEDCLSKTGKIFIYGDYDVDGMTSTTILVSALKKLGFKVKYHIPHRFNDGYGLNMEFINKLLNQPPDILITLDCGISNFKEIEKFKAHSSSKVIIMDHHTIPDKVPQADAIINPKQLPQTNPLYNLCTAGIVYKFLEYYLRTYNKNIDVQEYLDLASIGTIADVMPLTRENRKLVKLGLKNKVHSLRTGLKELLNHANFKKDFISVRDVGFIIAPRLNAAGRLSHANQCVELLLSSDTNEAKTLAFKLQKLNEHRQQLGKDIFTEAVTQWQKQTESSNVILMSNPTWHAGIIGITASRLVDRYGAPTVLIAQGETIGRGSARSSGSVNIYNLLKEYEEFFENFGGHKAAAGFSILPENITKFTDKFLKTSSNKVDKENTKPMLNIDLELSPELISLDFAQTLSKLEPFGHGNPAPIFYTNKLSAIDLKTVGDGTHIKATFTNDKTGLVIDAIGFGLANKLDLLYKNNPEILFNLEINSWQGKESPQLQILDIK